MIRKLAALVLLLGATAAPALAQLPPEIQEMVDKVHVEAEGGRLAAVETVPEAFQRMSSGDLLHKPSGFVCPHTAATLSGFMPGFVTIFDNPKVAGDIGCGMIARNVNMSVFVFKRDGDVASVLSEEAGAARRDSPLASRQENLPPSTAAALGLPAGASFGANVWVDTAGAAQAVYLVRAGGWYVNVRLTMSPDQVNTGVAQAARIFSAALQQIRS